MQIHTCIYKQSYTCLGLLVFSSFLYAKIEGCRFASLSFCLFLSLLTGSNKRIIEFSPTPAKCKWTESSLSWSRKKRLCFLGSRLVNGARTHFKSPVWTKTDPMISSKYEKTCALIWREDFKSERNEAQEFQMKFSTSL